MTCTRCQQGSHGQCFTEACNCLIGPHPNRPRRVVTRADSIQRQFEQFHAANPRVYTTLVALTERARNQGKERVGVGALWEVMRWEMYLLTEGDEFKLNNNFRSRYVRLIQKQRPDLASLFETRALRAG